MPKNLTPIANPDLSQEHPTVLEIDLGALKHNLLVLRSRLREKTKFLAVVKAFAYGSDALKIAQTLEDEGVDYLAVAYTSEGIALRDGGIRLPILVLHPQPDQLGRCIDRCLEPSIYSPRLLRAFVKTAEEKQQNDYPIHLKFNTGLNRLGFWENDVDWVNERLQNTRSTKVKGLLSHLAASDDPAEKEFTQTQLKQFEKIGKELVEKLGYQPLRHLLNLSLIHI